MTIDEGLKNKLSTLASTNEWKEVKELFFDKQIDELLMMNRELNILPDGSTMNLDYKDLLLARQVAGKYLVSMLKIIDICHKKASTSSQKKVIKK